MVFDSRFEVFWTMGSEKIDFQASFLSAKIFFFGIMALEAADMVGDM